MRKFEKFGKVVALCVLTSFLTLTAAPTYAAAEKPAKAQAQSVPAANEASTQPQANPAVEQPVPLTEVQMQDVKGEFWPLVIVGLVGAGYLIYLGVSGKGLPGSR